MMVQVVDEWFLKPRPNPTTDHKCASCIILIEWLMHPPTDPQGPAGVIYRLGTLKGLGTSQCPLLRLFSDAYGRYKLQTAAPDANIDCRLEALTSDTFERVLSPATKLHRRIWTVEFGFYEIGGAEVATRKSPLHLRLAADDVVYDGSRSLLNMGKVIEPDRVRAGFLDQILHSCLAHHGKPCARPTLRNPSAKRHNVCRLPLVPGVPAHLRLIDVQRSCLVEASPGSEYVALSYVWGPGSCNSLLLLETTREALYKPGGVATFEIPRTILDAIEVTRSIGQKYLWVDAICIQQDNVQDKAIQIANMDNIYSNALVTIVAAAGTNARAGLPGINPDFPRIQPLVAKALGFRFLVAAQTMIDVLKRGTSPWATRAWTYQEYRLSRRMLIFTEQQVIWKCQKDEMDEDYVGELSRNVQSLALAPQNEGHQLNVLPTTGKLHYAQIASEYSSRHLSFDNDALNAVSGVLSYYGMGTRQSFLCGLPVSTLFEVGLMWFARSGNLRRRGPCLSGDLFPSWSWVGWEGDIWYTHFDYHDDDPERKIIQEWYLEHQDGALSSYSLESEPETQSTGDSGIARLLPSLQTGILCFNAKVARYLVEQTPWSQFRSSTDTDCQTTGLYKILHGSEWIGSVHLEHRTRSELGGPDRLHDFVAISTSTDEDDAWDAEKDAFDPDTEMDFCKVFDEKLLEGQSGHVYNVLLIYHTGSHYVRKGIGQIHKGSWERSPWQRHNVRLG